MMSFKWRNHSIDSKARSRIGLIGLLQRPSALYLLILIYFAFVWRIPEYCNNVWLPRYSVNIVRIQYVQKRFWIYALGHFPWNSSSFLSSYKDLLKRQQYIIRNLIFVENFKKIVGGSHDYDYLLKEMCSNVKPSALCRNKFWLIRF